MNTSHHLDEATLMRYASGDLDPAFAVVVASHVAMCAECRDAVRDAEEIGGQLLSQGGAAELPADAFDRLMTRIDNGEGIVLRERGARPAGGDVPLPLRRLIGPSLDAVAWRTVAPGVRKCDLKPAAPTRSKLYMLNIAPGLAVPEHGHGGAEITLVLSGAYRDAFGRFGPGDVADLDEHVEHMPRVDSDTPCICLVATEAPTRFKGLFSRLLQPLVGI